MDTAVNCALSDISPDTGDSFSVITMQNDPDIIIQQLRMYAPQSIKVIMTGRLIASFLNQSGMVILFDH
jgi:hypothetical protein